jgi:hypothetical protein
MYGDALYAEKVNDLLVLPIGQIRQINEALHLEPSNVPGNRRAQANPRTWRRVRARLR